MKTYKQREREPIHHDVVAVGVLLAWHIVAVVAAIHSVVRDRMRLVSSRDNLGAMEEVFVKHPLEETAVEKPEKECSDLAQYNRHRYLISREICRRDCVPGRKKTPGARAPKRRAMTAGGFDEVRGLAVGALSAMFSIPL
jgi:hypothetical protein